MSRALGERGEDMENIQKEDKEEVEENEAWSENGGFGMGSNQLIQFLLSQVIILLIYYYYFLFYFRDYDLFSSISETNFVI